MLRTLIAVAFAITLSFPASAQIDGTLEVHIPFQFVAGSSTLPAGYYTIRRINSDSAYVITSRDGKHSEIVLTSQRVTTNTNKQAALHFRRYGSKHFLAQLLIEGDNTIRQVAKSRAEKDIESGLIPHTTTPETITIPRIIP